MLWISFTACTLTTYPQMDDWIFRTFLLYIQHIAAILDKAVHIFFIACQYILKLPSKGQGVNGQVLPVYSKDRLRFPHFMAVSLKIRVNQQNAIV